MRHADRPGRDPHGRRIRCGACSHTARMSISRCARAEPVSGFSWSRPPSSIMARRTPMPVGLSACTTASETSLEVMRKHARWYNWIGFIRPFACAVGGLLHATRCVGTRDWVLVMAVGRGLRDGVRGRSSARSSVSVRGERWELRCPLQDYPGCGSQSSGTMPRGSAPSTRRKSLHRGQWQKRFGVEIPLRQDSSGPRDTPAVAARGLEKPRRKAAKPRQIATSGWLGWKRTGHAWSPAACSRSGSTLMSSGSSCKNLYTR
jgi:hypothetical protein